MLHLRLFGGSKGVKGNQKDANGIHTQSTPNRQIAAGLGVGKKTPPTFSLTQISEKTNPYM